MDALNLVHGFFQVTGTVHVKIPSPLLNRCGRRSQTWVISKSDQMKQKLSARLDTTGGACDLGEINNPFNSQQINVKPLGLTDTSKMVY